MTPLRFTLFLAWTLAQATSLLAQPPTGAGRPANGRVLGKVIDASTGKPAEFATITVNALRGDSLLGGTIVRNNGDFVVDRIPLVPLKVTISFIGYEPQVREVELSRGQQERDLGNIVLKPDAKVLKEFEVTGEKRTSIMQVDRRVYNVDKDLTTQGASAVEVMKNIPGLSVDVDGNVEMRGSNPQVLINGRPTTMTLEMIPAEDIERVELITNPSAAFDANTTGGILNVVLKKNTRPGYSGQVQAGIGTNDRYQAGANLNVKDGRWGFNLSYNFNTSRNKTNAFTRRTDRYFGEDIGHFEQDTRSESGRRMNGGRFGVDWELSNRSTLSISNSLRWFTHDGNDDQDFFTRGAAQELLTQGEQISSNRTDRANYMGQVMFKHRSPKEGKEWSMDFTYDQGRRESFAEQDLYSYGADGGAMPSSPRLQDNLGWSRFPSYTFQADAVDPITERTKIEYGLKGSLQPDHTVLEVRLTSPVIGTDVLDSAMSNDYEIQNMVNAAYVNWSQQLSTNWSMMTGLRFEQTWFEAKLNGTGEVYDYRYPDGTANLGRALFPSLYFVRRREGSEREFQINFSRKIDRPRFWQIIPFIMYSDARNVRIGNPTLAPEMGNLAEVNHLLPFLGGKATWLTSVFGRYSTDVVTGYASPLATDSSILLNTFVNGSYESMVGWENVLKVDPVKGMQITLSGTVRHTNVALSGAQSGLRNQGVVWESKLMVNQRFGAKANWTLQLNGEYESPEVQAQGRTVAQYGVDASLSHDLTKRITGVISVNDLFFTRRWGNIIDTPLLYQESTRRREMRYVRFTLTWKFGEQNSSLFRRRGPQRSDPSRGGGEMDM